MLVLTRKTQQQIQIGPDITITILEVKGHSVRVGIVAPRDVNVFRTELAARTAQEQEHSQVSPAVQKAVARAARPRTGMPQATTSSTENGAEEQPSVRCRAPRVVVTPPMKHPVRSGPASLDARHQAPPLPLDSRLRSLLAR